MIQRTFYRDVKKLKENFTLSTDPQRLTMQLEVANSNTVLDFDVSICTKS